MAEASLHSDTTAWLEVRNAYRDLLAAAISGATSTEVIDLAADAEAAAEAAENAPGNEELQEAAEAAQEALQAALDACPNGGGCPDLNGAFAAWPPAPDQDIEQQVAENGWPDCADLYESLDGLFKGEGLMEEIIIQQRQANTLESYRKMLLHKKQGRCQLFAAWGACLNNEGASQSQLEQLMLNQRVGTTGSATTETDNGDGA